MTTSVNNNKVSVCIQFIYANSVALIRLQDLGLFLGNFYCWPSQGGSSVFGSLVFLDVARCYLLLFTL